MWPLSHNADRASSHGRGVGSLPPMWADRDIPHAQCGCANITDCVTIPTAARATPESALVSLVSATIRRCDGRHESINTDDGPSSEAAARPATIDCITLGSWLAFAMVLDTRRRHGTSPAARSTLNTIKPLTPDPGFTGASRRLCRREPCHCCTARHGLSDVQSFLARTGSASSTCLPNDTTHKHRHDASAQSGWSCRSRCLIWHISYYRT